MSLEMWIVEVVAPYLASYEVVADYPPYRVALDLSCRQIGEPCEAAFDLRKNGMM